MKEEEKSICWLGVIPECDKDKVRYPTDEEINQFIEEAENFIEQDPLETRPLVTRNKIYKNYLLNTDGELVRKYKSCTRKINKFLKTYPNKAASRYYWAVCDKAIDKHVRVGVVKALTFPELVGRSPLVRHFNLKYGDDVEVALPNGDIIRLIVNVDHIDRNEQNDEYNNLRFCTHVEQNLNTGPKNGSKFKGVYILRNIKSKRYRCKLELNRKRQSAVLFTVQKNFKIEEQAATYYNDKLKEILKKQFGNKLGQELIDEVAYFNNVIPTQQELDLDMS